MGTLVRVNISTETDLHCVPGNLENKEDKITMPSTEFEKSVVNVPIIGDLLFSEGITQSTSKLASVEHRGAKHDQVPGTKSASCRAGTVCTKVSVHFGPSLSKSAIMLLENRHSASGVVNSKETKSTS